MSAHIIDLRSDTVSMPTLEMRQAMFDAVVGDDVYGEDPTVLQLEQKAASIFDKESAIFVPSGTMANLLAIMVHCHRRGTEAIVGDLSHTFLYEQGGASHIAGVQLSTIKNEVDGTFSLKELRQKVRSHDYHEPITALVVVENTHNMCGGKVLPLCWIDKLTTLVRDPRLSSSYIALHMDGARIFNAAEFLQVPVSRISRGFDSVCFCLSKGLSAPVGSILVGTKTFIDQARRLRKSLGGGMRQAGCLAAAGIIGLEKIVPYLRGDHQNTKRIAEALHKLRSPNINIDIGNVQTNILLINIVNPNLNASDFASRLSSILPKELSDGITLKNNPKSGILLKVSSRDWEFVRIVLHHQITAADTDLAIIKLTYVIKEFDNILSS